MQVCLRREDIPKCPVWLLTRSCLSTYDVICSAQALVLSNVKLLFTCTHMHILHQGTEQVLVSDASLTAGLGAILLQATVCIWAGQIWHTRLMHSFCCRSWGNKRRRTLPGASASPPEPPVLAPASVLNLDVDATGALAQANAPSRLPSRVDLAAGQPVMLWCLLKCDACQTPAVLPSHSQPASADTVRNGSATLRIAAAFAATSHCFCSSTLTRTGSALRDSPVHCLSLVARLQMLAPRRLSQGCRVTAPGREAQMRSRPASQPVARPAPAAASLSSMGATLGAGSAPLRLLSLPQTLCGMQSPSPPLSWPTLPAALAAVPQPHPPQRLTGSQTSCPPLCLSCPPVTQRSRVQQTRPSRAQQTRHSGAAQRLAREPAAKLSVRWGCAATPIEMRHVDSALHGAVQACMSHGQHAAAAAGAVACRCMQTSTASCLTDMAQQL